jgi:diguanylate cyclase (GGDEF)-like protein/PAS domain S-box-containing protein
MRSKFSTLSQFLLPIILLLVLAPVAFLSYLTSEQLRLIKLNEQGHAAALANLLELKQSAEKKVTDDAHAHISWIAPEILAREINQKKSTQNTVVFLLDEAQKVILHSDNISRQKVVQYVQNPPGDWVFVKAHTQDQHIQVVIGYPLAEARALGFRNLTMLIFASAVLGVTLIVIILLQIKRLIIEPIGADPSQAIQLVQKIAQGNLAPDNLKADEGTLMAHVLSMRKKLREFIQTLEENSKRLTLAASVFNHAHDGIFITDANFNIIDVNLAFARITGFPKEMVIGHRPVELGFAFQDVDYFDKLLHSHAQEKSWRGEVWNLHNDGNVYAAWLDVFAVHDDQGTVIQYVGLFSDISEVKEQQKNLERMAYHDPLTQLPNRTLFAERLNHELKSIHPDDLLAICYFDLDGFKPVNDVLGHAAGDALLITFATRMRACLRNNDTIARLGGDEFAVLLSGLKSKDECTKTLDRLLEVIRLPYEVAGQTVQISASIGYTIYPLDQSEPDTLIRHADHAMYHVKVNGRGFHHMFDAEHDRKTQTDLRERETVLKALPNGEFRLFYQPKVNLLTGEVVGLEALIRWMHPEKGLRSPAEFLPILEQDTVSSIQIGEWVIAEAMRQIGVWQKSGLTIKVSVNIAAKHMMQINFAERLEVLLNECGEVSPALLELEITETAAIEDIASVANTIIQCEKLGVGFALDDFGVGYSSLTYLRRLPVEVIKIDQSFIRDMLHDEDDKALVSGVINLGRSFGLDVVAEGVETAEHGVQLLKLGCEIAQGYGISRPMEAEKVLHWVRNYQPDESWLNYNQSLQYLA